MMDTITLKNKDNFKLIKDLVIRPLKVNKDESGILVETLRTDWQDIYGNDRQFAMQYFSITKSGVARDEGVWHYHPTVQDDRFLLAQGEIVVAVADNRDNSSTKGLLNLFHIISDSDPYEVLIPRKTLHGFLVVSDIPAILLNFPTQLYNPSEEGRVPFNEAGIKTGSDQIFSWNMVRQEFNLPLL